MNQSIRRGGLAAAAASLALVLAACGSSIAAEGSAGTSAGPDADASGSTDASAGTGEDTGAGEGNDSEAGDAELVGNLAGAGASSQAKAQEGWMAGFAEANPGLTVTYDPVGSGGGRSQLLSGGVLIAGTDSLFKEEEIAAAKDRCFGGELLELPVYISPIAVIYNLPDTGVDHLNLDSETIAMIFRGEIATWDDAAIAAQNPDATLPATAITVVNRSDDSGTTENFTDYLHATSGGVWTDEPSDAWPLTSQQSGDGTSGVITTVASAVGAIGYADASQAGDLGTVALKVGEDYVPFSPAAAAQAVDASPLTADATDLRITYELDRATTEPGSYPMVLISYLAACDTYDDAADAANVAGYLSYIASPEGQERASQTAGSAPISPELRARVDAAIATISGS